MDIAALKKFVEIIKDEVEKIKEDGAYTKARKKQILDAIGTALDNDTKEESLAIAIDNLIHLIADTKELKAVKNLNDAAIKLSKFANDWIQKIYGKSTSFDRQDKDGEPKNKTDSKDTTSPEAQYLKLLKEISKAMSDAEQYFHSYRFPKSDDRNTEKENLDKLDRTMKQIKTKVSTDLDQEQIRNLLRLVDKAKTTYEPTMFGDMFSGIAKKVAKFVTNHVMAESEELVASLILEYATVTTISDKLQRLIDVAKGDEKENEIKKIAKTIKQIAKDGMKDSDLLVGQIEALEELKKVVKTTIKQEIAAVIKDIEDSVGEELSESVNGKGKLVRISYEVWDEDALEAGETDDRGWENEEGIDFSKDVDETPSKDVANYLKKEGATEPSSSIFAKDVWYSSTNTDIKSGDTKIKSYHLAGDWTEDELKEIYNIITKKKNISESYYDGANYLLL